MNFTRIQEMFYKKDKEECVMKKRWMTVFCAVLFMTLIMVAADVKASAETSVWDEGKEEVYTEGAFTYYIHPSQSGEEAP